MLHTEKRWKPDDYLPLIQRGKVERILPCCNCSALPMPDVVLACPGTGWSTWHLECTHCWESSPSYPPRSLDSGQAARLNPNPLAGAIDNWNHMQERHTKGTHHEH